MAYSQRKPPITIELTIDDFNILMETIMKAEEQYFKHKLLLYSTPQDNKGSVSFGLFPREVEALIVILVKNLKNKTLTFNYYNTLKKVKRKIEEVKFNNE